MGKNQKAMQPISVQSNQDYQMGMDNLEEVPGVHGDTTNNTCPAPAPEEMERGITQDPLAI
jgi:hypothetical protein